MREKGEYLLPANSLLWRGAEPPSPGDGVQEWRWMDAAGEAGANCGKKGRENWEEPYLVFALRLLSSLCAAAAAKSLQSYPTLCDPIDGSPPGSPIPGILQARTLECCHFLLKCMKGKVKVKSPNRVWLLLTPWTTAYQAPPSMGFSRQEYWSRLPFPSPSLCWSMEFLL